MKTGRSSTESPSRTALPATTIPGSLSSTSRSPGQACKWDTKRRQCYWVQMAREVFSTVRSCRDSIWIRRRELRRQKLMQLVIAVGPLDRNAVNLLCSLKKTAQKSALTLARAERLISMKRCPPLLNSIETTETAVFLDYCAYAYLTGPYIINDSKKQLTASFIHPVRLLFSFQHYPSTAYHARKTGRLSGLVRN